MKEIDNIDKLFREHLENFNEDTNRNVWQDMRWSLFWFRNKTYIITSAIAMVLILSGLWYLQSNDKNAITQNTEVYNPVKVSTITAISEEEQNEQLIENYISDEIINSSQQENEISSSAFADNNYTEPKINKSITDEFIDNNSAFTETGITHEPVYITSLTLHDNQLDVNEINPVLLELPGLETEKEKNNISLKLNIFGGPSFPFGEVTSAKNEYTQYRNDSEKAMGSWSTGINLKVEKNNWVITTGINYSEYNQHYSYNSSYEEYSPDDSYYTYDTIWGWLFDPPNVAIPVVIGVDSTWNKVYNTIDVNNSGINRTRYIEIPVMLGYRINKNLFSFEFNAGASIGFLNYYNFKIPDYNDQTIVISNDDMTKTMINFSVNTTIYYYLNKNTSLFVSPYYKRNLKPVFTDGSYTNQFNNIYGINFGISWTLK